MYAWGGSMWDGVGAQRGGREGAQERVRGRGWEGYRQGQREQARRMPYRKVCQGACLWDIFMGVHNPWEFDMQ